MRYTNLQLTYLRTYSAQDCHVLFLPVWIAVVNKEYFKIKSCTRIVIRTASKIYTVK